MLYIGSIRLYNRLNMFIDKIVIKLLQNRSKRQIEGVYLQIVYLLNFVNLRAIHLLTIHNHKCFVQSQNTYYFSF